MLVIAKKLGIFQGRRKPGEKFDFPDALCRKGADGKLIPPSWCAPASPESEREIKDAAKADARKNKEAAIAAAGPKRAAKGYATAENPEDLV
jgi:hypothetical protein